MAAEQNTSIWSRYLREEEGDYRHGARQPWMDASAPWGMASADKALSAAATGGRLQLRAMGRCAEKRPLHCWETD